MHFHPPYDVAGPGLLIGLGLPILALIIMFCLIVIIESAALQWMRWGVFRRSLAGSFWMNLVSTLVGFSFLALVPALGYFGLFIAWVFSVVIEAIILMRLKPGDRRHNWIVSLVANLASYLILLLPTYYFSQG